MNRRCCCLAIAEVRRRRPDYLPQVPNTNVQREGAPVIDADALDKIVTDMTIAAGHYKNWEKELGVRGGIALVLGNRWPESSWTKLVGKSGDWFKQVADRLREVNLPQEAEKYAELEKELIEYKVQGLLTEAQDK